ncbi:MULTISPECIES: alpha/beta fold hydrolase [Micromonospora]|uniref:alpha/beta fold hydrolase n=1 Tax=Micromonospora TaxID=1873 RepID=UPI001EE93BEA|nr:MULTISPECIES: alpha/beta hydrolase [Micromonospora]MCG5452422.1 alpha/beta hydrolase [Micromonospora hortensis]MCX5120542.1 alpha/beta hydrolase [Micromonospora sp. NBC_00362]WTI07503.1 alpha/beta hydrolase [Micromonospora sp. NBC_00821]
MVGIAQKPSVAAVQEGELPVTHFRTATVNGIDIFYREAGPADGPAVLLLHGFPTSSAQFRHLIPLLADRYRVIAPDFPGFGHSASPDRSTFDYTFANFADLMDGLLSQLGVDQYALYCFDYGAPTGFRMALKGPERISALIVQNGNAYEEGLSPFWDPIKAYWAEKTDEHRQAIAFILKPETVKLQYTQGVQDLTRLDPDMWIHDDAQLARPGNADIQLDLFYDYGSNVTLYPEFHAFFRDHQPPTLIIWGQNDSIFPPDGAHPYRRDLPSAEFHLLDTGHFLLEDKLDVAAPMIHDFLDRSIGRS